MTSFDERAREWDADPAKVARAVAVADAMRRELPLSASMRCLEYGCGTGLLSFALRYDVGAIALADASEGMLAVLRDKIAAAGAGNMTPLKLDLATDALPAGRFDLICSLMVLHHVPEPAGILRKFRELLDPGGWVAICDLDAEDGSFHDDPAFTGHKGFDRAALGREMEAAGFAAPRAVTPYVIERETAAGIQRFPLFLMMASKPL
jgi:2-polyprenyl-3-methyl-5-hydroxy-6-metoxy-1,4-benzoquinol methylase